MCDTCGAGLAVVKEVFECVAGWDLSVLGVSVRVRGVGLGAHTSLMNPSQILTSLSPGFGLGAAWCVGAGAGARAEIVGVDVPEPILGSPQVWTV